MTSEREAHSNTEAVAPAKVAFLVAGAVKCGTTALDHFLRQHPGIAMPLEKEVHFFDVDMAFPQWGPMYDVYHSYYPAAADGVVRGEATPTYMYSDVALDRIRAYNPAMKIIVLLRSPAERAYSHYRMMRRFTVNEPDEWRMKEDRPFWLALLTEKRRVTSDWRKDFPSAFYSYAYVARSRYASSVTSLRERFPRDQLLFLQTNDLRDRHDETMQRILGFIGVDASVVPGATSVGAGDYGSLPKLYRRYLVARCRRDVETLEALLGWDLTDWKR